MRSIALVVLLLAVSGCSSSKMLTFEVRSDPSNAPIEVNGYSMGRTPTTIELNCSKIWVGLLNSPDGWANKTGSYVVTAYPPEGASGDSQTKTVDPCSWKGDGRPVVYFDLTLTGVNPVDRIQLEVSERAQPSEVSSERDKLLLALRDLRNSGALTEEEYQEKVLEVLDATTVKNSRH